MKVEFVDINKIKPYKENPRKISEKAIKLVTKSIEEYGFRQPIVVDKDNVIIVGHTRFESAKRLDLKEVPVNVADLSDEKAKAYRIADNRVNEETSWDNEKLTNELNRLLENDYDLDLIGFTQEELDSLFTKDEIIFDDEDYHADENHFEGSDVLNDVKMMQLFFKPDDDAKIREYLQLIQEKHKISNISDAIFLCVKNENDKIKSNLN